MLTTRQTAIYAAKQAARAFVTHNLKSAGLTIAGDGYKWTCPETGYIVIMRYNGAVDATATRIANSGVTCTIVASGDLIVSADKEARADLRQAMQSTTHAGIWADLLEAYSCNGSFTPFDAGDANPSVGLTDAPCIAEQMDTGDYGQQSIVGRFWAFLDYQTQDELATLADQGHVRFSFTG